MIGSTLAHFKITAHLGSGGMGEVYQATDTKLGRSVAIKLLPEAFARDAERVGGELQNWPNSVDFCGFDTIPRCAKSCCLLFM